MNPLMHSIGFSLHLDVGCCLPFRLPLTDIDLMLSQGFEGISILQLI
jgi:hypothetical protein